MELKNKITLIHVNIYLIKIVIAFYHPPFHAVKTLAGMPKQARLFDQL